ncbi:hypothetical protein AAG747_29020 [Rapidithrix thailandica]|uniref:Capsule polysaccharide biosynthesis protein n=1 Tax=Rapidithrix thailandica TaxID=413964 RepID=A0AAW9SF33_9BACT
MKILFVENRYKTYFYDAIAKELLERGYDVYWIIQNHMFKPSNGKIEVIPYPTNHGLLNKSNCLSAYEKVIKSDRQLNFFSLKTTSHIFYYQFTIERVIDKLKPDIVFGEATAFHELLTIEICKGKNILYLNPSTCRYPVGRFSFYKYDTLEPYKGSQQVITNSEALSIINQIVNRNVKPNYMNLVQIQNRKRFYDKLKILRGYYGGDKYNTPSPIVKWRKEKYKKLLIKQWEDIAYKEVADGDQAALLYPMQMQPEANIDVWGREYRDQFNLIKELAKQLSKNEILYIKPNPKSKYEISKELINYCDNANNVKLISHQTPMEKVFPKVDLVITVTGTIAIECILANKPVLTLVETINNTVANCVYLDDIGTIDSYIKSVKKDAFPKLSNSDKIKFLNLLISTSYNGVISDPFMDKNSVSNQNIKHIVGAFDDILSGLNV